MEIKFNCVVPILRIFDIAKADEFYQEFLGFSVDWDLILHLSEHRGDGSPGARIRVMMQGVEEFHRGISSKGYRYMRPGLESTPWGTIETGVIDPFGNLIRFCEPKSGRRCTTEGYLRVFSQPLEPETCYRRAPARLPMRKKIYRFLPVLPLGPVFPRLKAWNR